MDSFPVMLTLKGNNPLIQNILLLKGVPFTHKPQHPEVTLESREINLWDEGTIVQYIDERFPSPQLINGDVENRARIRMVSQIAYNDEQACEQLADSADPFIFGKQITLVDLIVYQKSHNKPFKQRIENLIRQSRKL